MFVALADYAETRCASVLAAYQSDAALCEAHKGHVVLHDVLQHLPFRTPRPRTGGLDLTISECARSIVASWARAVPRHGFHVCCMDDAAHITALRGVQELKRGRPQPSARSQASVYASHDPEKKHIAELGVWYDLMGSKSGFRPVLAAEIAEAMKNKNFTRGWHSAKGHLEDGATLAFVGPAHAVVVTQGQCDVTLANGCSVPARRVAKALQHVHCQGEGERMCCTAALRLLDLEAEVRASGTMPSASFVLRSADTDTAAALAPAAFHLAVSKHPGWGGTMVVVTKPKTKAAADRCGAMLFAANSRISGARAATGTVQVVLDVRKLYDVAESDESLPQGTRGSRALSLTTGIYSFVGRDYINSIAGVTYARAVEALRDKRYYSRAVRDTGDNLLLVKAKPGGEVDVCIEGLCLLAHVLTAKNVRVHKMLQALRSEHDMLLVSYELVRAAAKVCMLHPPPLSEASWLVRFAAVRLLILQDVDWQLQDKPAFNTTAEIEGTPYVVSKVGNVRLRYRVSSDNASEMCGDLVDLDFGEGSVFGSPSKTLRDAATRGGFEPLLAVDAGKLFPPGAALHQDQIDDIATNDNKVLVRLVLQNTLIAHTVYDTRQKLLRNGVTLYNVVTNRGDPGWSAPAEWSSNGGVGAANVKDALQAVEAGDSADANVKKLAEAALEATKHVVWQTQVALARGSESDGGVDDGDEPDEEYCIEGTDYSSSSSSSSSSDDELL